MTEIKAQASSYKKWSNTKEYYTVPTVTAEGITIEGFGFLMPKIAQALIDSGKPPDYTLSLYRGDMECLKPFPLLKWASGKAGKGKQPEQLKKKDTKDD